MMLPEWKSHGCIFPKIILENGVPVLEMRRLINEDGEESGHLVEVGFAA